MPRKQKKYHYIYKTTCQITGKFYVGMHSTDNLDDDYLGSGKILGYSIAKHGKENHKREILEQVESREALKLREKEIVNEELLADPLNINLKYGGEGGWDHLPAEITRANAIRNSGFRNFEKLSDDAKSRIEDGKRRGVVIGGSRGGPKTIHLATKVAASKESCDKRRATMAKRGQSQGIKNSQFGTCWIKKDGIVKKIKLSKLQEYLGANWVRGR